MILKKSEGGKGVSIQEYLNVVEYEKFFEKVQISHIG